MLGCQHLWGSCCRQNFLGPVSILPPTWEGTSALHCKQLRKRQGGQGELRPEEGNRLGLPSCPHQSSLTQNGVPLEPPAFNTFASLLLSRDETPSPPASCKSGEAPCSQAEEPEEKVVASPTLPISLEG